ncbi:MAG TPA: FprA family A-type flavoprotein [Bacilli bacterium]|nr:FprA family A-type flavoprotein [Bacilli bacterium]HPS19216.1 FprA family A-type flavoprotein [Bacilli bacterium]
MINYIDKDLIMFHETSWDQSLFEGEIPLANGMSYNSYLFLDEKTCLLDTSARETKGIFFQELKDTLNGRHLDCLVIHHLEPDHTALTREVVKMFPDIKIYISMMGSVLFKNFFPDLSGIKFNIIKDGDRLNLGKHLLRFIAAPMIHWPEVMMSYEENHHLLFSADAFGSFFTAHNPYEAHCEDKKLLVDETRRYFTNIISKYSPSVLNVLNQLKAFPLEKVLSLHGLIHENNIPTLLSYYEKWSTSTKEEEGVLILYASIYGHTEEAALYLEKGINSRGIKTIIHSLNQVDVSYALSDSFIFSKIVLLAPTFNVGLYPKMDIYLQTLISHNVQNKHFYLVENGSWAPQAKELMKKAINQLSNCTIDQLDLTIKSALKPTDYQRLDEIIENV